MVQYARHSLLPGGPTYYSSTGTKFSTLKWIIVVTRSFRIYTIMIFIFECSYLLLYCKYWLEAMNVISKKCEGWYFMCIIPQNIVNRPRDQVRSGFRSFARDGRLRCHRLESPSDPPPQNYGTWCPAPRVKCTYKIPGTLRQNMYSSSILPGVNIPEWNIIS